MPQHPGSRHPACYRNDNHTGNDRANTIKERGIAFLDIDANGDRKLSDRSHIFLLLGYLNRCNGGPCLGYFIFCGTDRKRYKGILTYRIFKDSLLPESWTFTVFCSENS